MILHHDTLLAVLTSQMDERQSAPQGPLKMARQFTGGMARGEDRKCRRHD